MILTCPECSTRYTTTAEALGQDGRSVRCARCQTVWYAEVRPTASASESDLTADSLALADNATLLAEPEPEPQPELPLGNPNSVGAHVKMRAKAEAERLSRRMRVIRAIWAVPALVLLGGFVASIALRQTIVDRYPAAATLYAGLGMTVKAGALDIQEVESQVLSVDGQPILRVTGKVRNLSEQAKIAPMVEMRLNNRSGETVASWLVEVGAIEAAGTARIETDYPAPPVDGVDLAYGFVSDGSLN